MNAWLARIGFVFVTAAVVWLVGSPSSSLRSQTIVGDASGDTGAEALKVVSSMLPNGMQQIVVVEASGRTMAVYHVEPAQGKIQLRSVRNLTWDLRMEQFNGQSPLPSELRQVQP